MPRREECRLVKMFVITMGERSGVVSGEPDGGRGREEWRFAEDFVAAVSRDILPPRKPPIFYR